MCKKRNGIRNSRHKLLLVKGVQLMTITAYWIENNQPCYQRFNSWDEFHATMFNPEIELIKVCVVKERKP